MKDRGYGFSPRLLEPHFLCGTFLTWRPGQYPKLLGTRMNLCTHARRELASCTMGFQAHSVWSANQPEPLLYIPDMTYGQARLLLSLESQISVASESLLKKTPAGSVSLFSGPTLSVKYLSSRLTITLLVARANPDL